MFLHYNEWNCVRYACQRPLENELLTQKLMRISKSKWSRRLSPAELGLLAEQIHITIKRDIVVRGEHLMGANIELNCLVYFLCLFLDILKCTSVHYAMHVYIVLDCPAFWDTPRSSWACWLGLARSACGPRECEPALPLSGLWSECF